MTRERKNNKEGKKKALKSLKEKRNDKKVKKQENKGLVY